MTYKQIIKELKEKKYKPVYLLMGEENFYIDKISEYIANNVLREEEKSFNQTIVYGEDSTAASIDNTARRYPMMAERQIVIVKEAQNIKDFSELKHYCKKPTKTTMLVLCHKNKNVAKNLSVYKEIAKNGIVFQSKKLYDNQLPNWINNYVKDAGFDINPIAANMLADFLGTDLSKVANELDKLFISHAKDEPISTKTIEDNIGISKDFNNFELQKALGEKDILKVNRIVNHFCKNEKDNPPIVTIVSLFFFFSKILSYHFLRDKSSRNVASVLKVNPYFVGDYQKAAQKYNIRKTTEVISLLRTYDAKLRGINAGSASQGELLRELIYFILH